MLIYRLWLAVLLILVGRAIEQQLTGLRMVPLRSAGLLRPLTVTTILLQLLLLATTALIASRTPTATLIGRLGC